MCGIAAIIGTSYFNKEKITSMIKSIKHRGPDDIGYFSSNKIQMASARLSILDLSQKANMPMIDRSGRFVIIYNGEIYNFLELKKKFNLFTKSNSDTEILVELFSLLNVKCFDYLNGIFALIIFDKINNKIYCARDRLGVKPLYYYNDGDNLYFCSEIKGFKKVINNIEINEEIIKFYLTTGYYDFSKSSFYKNIFQVKQGTYQEIKVNDLLSREVKYWDLTSKSQITKLENPNSFFLDSFNLQQRSDTPIGLNVSSGIDSNLMISYFDKINTGQKNIQANSFYYSDKEFDKSNEIKEMSEYYKWKIDLHEITSEDIINNLENVLQANDEPIPGIPTVAKYLLIKRGYNSDCKVVIEGQGGDDIAAGYKYIYPLHLLDLFRKNSFIDLINESKNFMRNENMNFLEFINFCRNCIKGYFNGGLSADGTISSVKDILTFENKNQNKFYSEIMSNLKEHDSFLKKIIYRDIFFCKLPRILRTCDRTSMALSKELRVPILDHNIVEFFFNSNNKELIKNGTLRNKYKEIYQGNFKINKFMRKRKYYLDDPQTKWFKNDLYDWVRETILINQSELFNFINKKKLTNYIDNFKTNKNLNNSNFIMQLINLRYLLKSNG